MAWRTFEGSADEADFLRFFVAIGRHLSGWFANSMVEPLIFIDQPISIVHQNYIPANAIHWLVALSGREAAP